MSNKYPLALVSNKIISFSSPFPFSSFWEVVSVSFVKFVGVELLLFGVEKNEVCLNESVDGADGIVFALLEQEDNDDENEVFCLNISGLFIDVVKEVNGDEEEKTGLLLSLLISDGGEVKMHCFAESSAKGDVLNWPKKEDGVGFSSVFSLLLSFDNIFESFTLDFFDASSGSVNKRSIAFVSSSASSSFSCDIYCKIIIFKYYIIWFSWMIRFSTYKK